MLPKQQQPLPRKPSTNPALAKPVAAPAQLPQRTNLAQQQQSLAGRRPVAQSLSAVPQRVAPRIVGASPPVAAGVGANVRQKNVVPDRKAAVQVGSGAVKSAGAVEGGKGVRVQQQGQAMAGVKSLQEKPGLQAGSGIGGVRQVVKKIVTEPVHQNAKNAQMARAAPAASGVRRKDAAEGKSGGGSPVRAPQVRVVQKVVRVIPSPASQGKAQNPVSAGIAESTPVVGNALVRNPVTAASNPLPVMNKPNAGAEKQVTRVVSPVQKCSGQVTHDTVSGNKPGISPQIGAPPKASQPGVVKTPVKAKEPVRVIGASSSKPAVVGLGPSQKTIPVASNKVKMVAPTQKVDSVTKTTIPQKRPPPIPQEALEAAARAAASVEPTPIFQSKTGVTDSSCSSRPVSVQPVKQARPLKAGALLQPKPIVRSTVTLVKPASTGQVQAAPPTTPVKAPEKTPVKPPPTHARIPEGMTFRDGEHVTIWNCTEKRKIAGNAAPLGKNVSKYLMSHPDCEVYVNQDQGTPGSRSGKRRAMINLEDMAAGDHVAIWNRKERRKIAGNAAPLAKNLKTYLAKRPDCEVYTNQDVGMKNGGDSQRSDGDKSSTDVSRKEEREQTEPTDEERDVGLDAWRNLSGETEAEPDDGTYMTDYELVSQFFLNGDGEEEVSPLVMSGPSHIEDRRDYDLNDFDPETEIAPFGVADFLEQSLPPLGVDFGIEHSN